MKISEVMRQREALLIIEYEAAALSGLLSAEHSKMADEIFRIAHAAVAPKCRKNHPNWTKKIDEFIRLEK